MKKYRDNLEKILKKVKSKYLLSMLVAKRSRQLASMESKEKKMNYENEKNTLINITESNKYLNEKEKAALSKHKAIVVALNELVDEELDYSFKKE